MSAYIVYADESWTHDPEHRHWRFYGGAMVLAKDRAAIEAELLAHKDALGLVGEIKWTQVRPFNWDRIAELLDHFLDLVESRAIKLRYMWLDQGFLDPGELTQYQREYGYFILYYYFAVFGFGLPWNYDLTGVQIDLLPDELPHEPVKRAEFRQFLMGCHRAGRFVGKSAFRFAEVGNVNSKDHILLQCVDVIIGAVGFRLNGLHMAKKPNGRRGEATKAKHALYKRLHQRLGRVDMGERGGHSFAFGVSTGKGSDWQNLWRHKFRQWNFRNGFNPNWWK